MFIIIIFMSFPLLAFSEVIQSYATVYYAYNMKIYNTIKITY